MKGKIRILHYRIALAWGMVFLSLRAKRSNPEAWIATPLTAARDDAGGAEALVSVREISGFARVLLEEGEAFTGGRSDFAVFLKLIPPERRKQKGS